MARQQNMRTGQKRRLVFSKQMPPHDQVKRLNEGVYERNHKQANYRIFFFSAALPRNTRNFSGTIRWQPGNRIEAGTAIREGT
jgi:hypothetical protein